MAKAPKQQPDARAEQAQRDLKRLDEQSEKLLGAQQEHAAPEDDEIEIWGKRIGRGLGIVFALYLVFHLYDTYFKAS